MQEVVIDPHFGFVKFPIDTVVRFSYCQSIVENVADTTGKCLLTKEIIM